MEWTNQGRIEGVRCWEMDHIYPLSKLDLTDPEVLRRAAHWSNMQTIVLVARALIFLMGLNGMVTDGCGVRIVDVPTTTSLKFKKLQTL